MGGGGPGRDPAHRAEVHEALVAVATSAERRYVVAERDGVAIGGAPAVIERRAGAHWLHALPHLLPAAPISSPGERADRRPPRVRGGSRHFSARPARRWGVVALPPIGCRLGRRAGVRARRDPHGEGGAASLRPDEAIESRLDRDARHSYRRAQASGLAFAEEPEALEEVYALYVAQSRRWRGHRPLALELSRRLIAARGSNGSGPVARLFTARDGRRLLVGILVLEHPRGALLVVERLAPGRARTARVPVADAAASPQTRRAAASRASTSAAAPGFPASRRSGARSARADVSYPVCWLDARFRDVDGPRAGRAPVAAPAASPSRRRTVMKISDTVERGGAHTRRWVEYFRERGHEVRVWSLEVGPPALAAERLASIPAPGFIRYPLATLPRLRALEGFGPTWSTRTSCPTTG